jgi:hypothetical protein
MIFKGMSIKEIGAQSRVCSTWAAILGNNMLWRELYTREWGHEDPLMPYKRAYYTKVNWVKRMLIKNRTQAACVGSEISHGGKVRY